MGKRADPSDFIGKKFGRLTVTGLITVKGQHSKVKYLCDCGNHGQAKAWMVKAGNTKSCGCINREVLRAARIAGGREDHGRMGTPEYVSWIAMKARCLNKNRTAFRYYGGRGITICDRWKKSFMAFYKDMGKRPEGHSIDRIDPDGNYEPGNCRWADRKTQANNKRNRQGTNREEESR